MQPSAHRRKSIIAWLVKLALTALVFAAIIWTLDPQKISRTFSSIPPFAIAGALALTAVQVGLAAKRLALVVATFGRQMKFVDALRVTMEAMFFSQTFVSFLGGDAQRILRVRACGFSLRHSLSIVTFDRFLGIMVNHIFVIMCAPFLLATMSSNSLRIGLAIIAAGGAGAIGLVLAVGFMHGRLDIPLLDRFRSNRFVQLLFEISTIGRHLFVRDRRIVAALGASLLMAASNSLIFFVILLGWGTSPSVAFACALLVPAILEVAMLPISIAGWGVREATVIFTFSRLGLSTEVAFGSSVAYALIVLAGALFGGLVYLFDQREFKALVPADAILDPTPETKAQG